MPATRVAGTPCWPSVSVVVVIVVVATAATDARDLPDHPGSRDLYERRVGRILELRAGIGTAWIADRAVVDQIERAVRPEAQRRRPVDAAQPVGERLVGVRLAGRAAVGVVRLRSLRAVEREADERQLERIALGEVDQLDVVAGQGRAVLRREAE